MLALACRWWAQCIKSSGAVLEGSDRLLSHAVHAAVTKKLKLELAILKSQSSFQLVSCIKSTEQIYCQRDKANILWAD